MSQGRLIRAMGLTGLFAGLAGLARIGQDAAIAWRHGAAAEVDAYYLAFNLVGWPATIALSTLTLAVAPVEASLRAQGGEALTRFRSELLGLVLLLAAALLPLAWAGLVFTLPVLGLPGATVAAGLAGVPGVFAAASLGLVAALLSAWLVSSAHTAVTLLEAAPAFTLALLVLALPGTALFWGTSAGVGLQVALAAALLASAGGLPRPRLGFASPVWRQFGRGTLVMLGGQVLFSTLPLVDQFFAAGLEGGTLAALGYANRLVLGLQGLLGLAVQRVALPVLSADMVSHPLQALATAPRWALKALLAGAVAALLVALLADPLVALLYERGRFDAEARAQVTQLLRWGVLQLPPFLAAIVFVTALASAQASHALALVAATGAAVKLLASSALVGPGGAVGLQLATALVYVSTASLAWWLLRRRARRLTTQVH